MSVVLFLLFSLNARAHDPGLSTLTVVLNDRTVEATMTLAPMDAGNIRGFGQPPGPGTSRDEVPVAIRTAEAEAIELRADGHPVSPARVRCRLDENHNLEARLAFDAGSSAKLSLRSRWLAQLAPGHRQFVSIQDAAGRVLAEKLLSANDDFIDVQTEAAPAIPTATVRTHSFSDFLVMGVKHIWTGYDHLLFLFGLLVVTRNFVSAAQIITCFTAAHSLTLAAATLSPVELLPSRVVEPLIAASIVYVGLENILRGGDPRGRWRLTFVFGLIHGLGFASALRELGVGANGSGIAVPLVSFNLGVELGQIAIAALALPLIWKLRTNPRFAPRWAPACSAVVALLGSYWFVQRVWF